MADKAGTAAPAPAPTDKGGVVAIKGDTKVFRDGSSVNVKTGQTTPGPDGSNMAHAAVMQSSDGSLGLPAQSTATAVGGNADNWANATAPGAPTADGGVVGGPGQDEIAAAAQETAADTVAKGGIESDRVRRIGEIGMQRARFQNDTMGADNPYSKFAQMQRALRGEQDQGFYSEASAGTMYDGSAQTHKSNLDYAQGGQVKQFQRDYDDAISAFERQEGDVNAAARTGVDEINRQVAARPWQPVAKAPTAKPATPAAAAPAAGTVTAAQLQKSTAAKDKGGLAKAQTGRGKKPKR